MNNTITLSQLITRLASVTGVDNNTARKFLRVLFSTIEDNLAAGHSVTVGKIGTFRPVSTNLSSDEVIVAFTPDKEIAKELNRPFEMFSAVELADGVEFDKPDTDMPKEEDGDDAEMAVESEQTVSESVAEPTDVTNEDVPVEDVKDTVTPLRWPEEEEREDDGDTDVDVSDENDVSDTDDDDEHPGGRRNMLWFWIALVFIAIVCGAYFAAVYTTPVKPVETRIVDSGPVDSVAYQIEEVSVEQIEAETQQAVAPATVETAVPQSETLPKEPVYDTVEVSLIRLAKKHYGESSYWVYIYDANRGIISNPNRISPGLRVLIPDASTFPGSTKKEKMDLAKARQTELLAKFK